MTDGEAETAGHEAEDDHALDERVGLNDDAELGLIKEYAQEVLLDTPVDVDDLKLAQVELTFVSEDGYRAAWSAESEDYDEDEYVEVP